MFVDRGHAPPVVADLPGRPSRAAPHSRSPVALALLRRGLWEVREVQCRSSLLLKWLLVLVQKPPLALLLGAPVGFLPQRRAWLDGLGSPRGPPPQSEESASPNRHWR